MTGTIMGTASYMAPEQIREGHVDHRADLFALGAILYELVTGVKAFPGETPADRMTAILTLDPKSLTPEIEAALPGLDAVIGRCLEKRADARFDSARDLAFTLQILAQAADAAPLRPKEGGTPAQGVPREARFQQLTYREGEISGANYASDGQTVVYSAAWSGAPIELFITRIGSHESRPIGLRDALLLDVSPSDELAVLLRSREMGGFIQLGVLARLPLMGGTPRELIDNVYQASFGSGGKIAAIRESGGLQLEYPIGTVLHKTQGWMSDPSVSPDGSLVAFVDHPVHGDSAGRISVVDLKGKVRHLTERFPSVWGAVWTPDGRQILCSAQESDGSNSILAIGLEGGNRSVLRGPGLMGVADISTKGDVLLAGTTVRMRMEFGTRAKPEVSDLSWFDWSLARDLSRDGSHVLFDETGPSVAKPMVFVRGTDGSPAMHIADGYGVALSPDGRWALVANNEDPSQFEIVPIGVGESVRHSLGAIQAQKAEWFPDGKSICFIGYEPGSRTRAYRYDLEKRTATPFAEEGVGRTGIVISPDGRWVWMLGPSGHAIYPVDGGKPRPLPGLPDHIRGSQWMEDGKFVLGYDRGRIPARVLHIDVESGASDVWMEVRAGRESGVSGINSICLTADGESYVASYLQTLNDLHTARGLL
jgi:hypothetical protein